MGRDWFPAYAGKTVFWEVSHCNYLIPANTTATAAVSFFA